MGDGGVSRGGPAPSRSLDAVVEVASGGGGALGPNGRLAGSWWVCVGGAAARLSARVAAYRATVLSTVVLVAASRTCWSQSQDTVRCVDVTAGAALASGCRTFVNGSRTADLSIQIRHRAGTRVHYRLYKQVAIGAPFCTHAYMHVRLARLLTVQVFTNNELRNKQKRNGVQASGYTLQL